MILQFAFVPKSAAVDSTASRIAAICSSSLANPDSEPLQSDANVITDDVGRAATLESADVRRRLLVDPSKRHTGNSLGRHLNGADSVFRINAGMCRTAVHMNEIFDWEGAATAIASDRSVGVQRIPVCGASLDRSSALRSGQSGLFSYRNDKLNLAMRQAILLHDTNSFQHRGEASLVIAAENGRAVAAQVTVRIQLRLNALARRHRIHMRSEEDNGSVHACSRFQLDEQIVGAMTALQPQPHPLPA